MKLLRGLAAFPCGLLIGSLVSGICLAVGDFVLGGWKLTSGIVIYVGALWLPSISFMAGFKIVPRKDRLVKWLLLTPYLLAAVSFVPILLGLIFAPDAFGEIPSGGGISRSLSPRFQWILWNFGYLVGVAVVASENVAKLRSRVESSKADRFQDAYRRAVTSRDPDDQMTAARQGLKLLETLEPWPFPPTMPSVRVARGTLLGVLANAYRLLRSRDPKSYSEFAVTTHEDAMQYLHEGDGDSWATLMVNASIAYADRLAGDPGQNLERAIKLIEAALERIDRSRDLASWQGAMANLAGYLAERKSGPRAENLKRALATQQEMLDSISRRSKPILWAKARGSLGALYLQQVGGDRSKYAELARSALEEALELIPKFKAPFEWAHTASDLAQVYGATMLAERRNNAKRADELLTEAAKVFASLGNQERWAGAQMSLGLLWSSAPPTADWPAAKAKSIEHIEKALTVFTAEEYPELHAQASSNLASARMGRLLVSDTRSIEAAISQSRQHLRTLNRETAPLDWAHARMNLAHRLLARQTRASIEEALVCYRDVLSTITRESAPEEWVSALSGLADGYAARREGVPAENMEQAIRYQEQALEALDPMGFPDAWVGAMHNLAISYQERMIGSRADNIEKVIALVETAMILRLSFERPDERSKLLELLGTSFLDRLRGDSRDNTRWAVETLETAQELRNPEASPAAWLRLDQKLTRARIKLHEDNDEEESPKEDEERPKTADFLAEVQRKASEVSRDDHLPTWVEAQVFLGDMYRRSAPDTKLDMEGLIDFAGDSQKTAIKIYLEALDAIDQQDEPALWAFVCGRVSTAYDTLHLLVDWRRQATPGDDHDPGAVARGENEARQALDNAAKYLDEVLEFSRFNPHQALNDYVRLGRIHVGRREWEDAHEALAEAARAADTLLADVEVNEQELTDTLRSLGRWAELAPYVFVVNGQIEQALEAAETAKARLLAKALTLEALDISAEEKQRISAIQDEVKTYEAKLTSPLLVHRMPPLEAAMRCRDELRRCIAGAAQHSAAELIDEITADGSVLVFPFLNTSPSIAKTDSHIVVAYRQAGARRTESLTVDEAFAFRAALKSELGDNNAEWQRILHERRRGELASSSWGRAVKACGRALHASFAEPLLRLLRRCGIERGSRLVILPQGSVGIWPLAVATGGASTLIDHYELSLSPSLRVLAAAKKRRAANGQDRSLAFCAYGKGDDSAADLTFLDFEGNAIASRFGEGTVERLTGKEATKDHCLQALARRTIWHFAAHAVFKDKEPSQSAIKLAEREMLTAAELIETRQLRKPSLVVLSACETGLYDQEDLPNEFIGLPVAFLQAGAEGVVATLWPVYDFLSSLVLSKFYELYMDRGVPPSRALRDAQLWLRDTSTAKLCETIGQWAEEQRITAHDASLMLEKIDRQDGNRYRPPGPPFADPAYWGGFIYYGA